MTGAERSLVTVGRSLTVANGFPPLWRNAAEMSGERVSERGKSRQSRSSSYWTYAR